MTTGAKVLSVRGLRVTLPNGQMLIEDLSLDVHQREAVVLLGSSGAGKSTLSRVLFERDALEQSGFTVAADSIEFDPTHLGLVPQRGALFDHLDVRGNLALAVRYAPRAAPAVAPETASSSADAPADWLARVGLDPALAAPGTSVHHLSGGQAQRIAVARALAGQRKILFLDEPSVGLDPHRVRMLARVIREQVRTMGLAVVVVTHDVALAAGVADRLFFLSPRTRRLTALFAQEWPGPLEAPGVAEAVRSAWLAELERTLVAQIAADHSPAQPASKPRRSPSATIPRPAHALVRPFATCATALRHLPAQVAQRPGDAFTVGRRVLAQTLLRPLVFYGIVSVLIGYTVLLIIGKVGGAGVRPDALIRQLGGSYVLALAPPLSAILFVAASGSATNAWLGSMALNQQTLAMEALGVPTRAYLWGPTWLALGLAYLIVAALFALGMIAGGVLVCAEYDITNGWALLTADILDPRPERVRFTVRAGFLWWLYGWGIASDVVAKGTATKRDADAVTRSMTASVVACTLWVVAWELVTVLMVLA